MGEPWAFMTALGIVIGWACVGPMFGFSDTWQLVINTTTSITTFLMVFLIQNTQNRDSKIIRLKLDELIRVTDGARNCIIELEALSDDELENLEAEFNHLQESHGDLPHSFNALKRLLAAHRQNTANSADDETE
jgi:low affinity Fe/Cu permease